jgi:hypothetical protein
MGKQDWINPKFESFPEKELPRTERFPAKIVIPTDKKKKNVEIFR